MFSDKSNTIKLQVVKRISKESKKQYLALELIIGNDEFPVSKLVFFPSPRDYAYVKQVLDYAQKNK